MTERPDPAVDPALSELYRQSATDTAPAHLDAAVLQQATDAARPMVASRNLLRRCLAPLQRPPLVAAVGAVVAVAIAAPLFLATDVAPEKPPLAAGSDAWPGQSSEPPGLCSERQQQSVPLWLDCINELEEGGQPAVAADERSRLLRAFPETRLDD